MAGSSVALANAAPPGGVRVSRFRGAAWRALRRSPQALFGSFVLVVVVICALFAPLVAPMSPTDQTLMDRLLAPQLTGAAGGLGHLLGTDPLGRDVFSRVIYGARISVFVGILGVTISASIGVVLGLIAGFFTGLASTAIMRLTDIVLSIPFLLLAIAVVAVLGPSLLNLVLVLGFTRWIRYARVTYAQTLSLKETEFVHASRAIGASAPRLLLRHIFPNTVAPIIVIATLELGLMVVFEAALSFLGLGVQPPTPSWGSMLAEGRNYVATAWWLAVFPGLAIMLTVLAVNLLGDWARDVLDPRMRTNF